VILHPLFHWAPAARRDAITDRGLHVSSDPATNTVRARYLCLSQTPSQAWALSADACGEPGEEWDCWQVTLDRGDEVHVRAFWGNRIEEIQVHNDIPMSRLWLVGTRWVPRAGGRP
jgi:hypothetical protein